MADLRQRPDDGRQPVPGRENDPETDAVPPHVASGYVRVRRGHPPGLQIDGEQIPRPREIRLRRPGVR